MDPRGNELTRKEGAKTNFTEDPSSDSPAFDPFPSPSPSPALSAYSCSSTSSADDLCDLDADLNSLSLEAIEEPHYHLTPSHLQPFNHLSNPHVTDPALHDPRQRYGLSGTTTPIASRSSASLRSTFHVSSPSSSSSGTSVGTYPSFQAALSPRPVATSSGSTSPANHNPLTESHTLLEDDQIEKGAEGDGFDLQDVDEDDMHADGVPAARGWRLDARQADTAAFRSKVLQLFSQELALCGWSKETVDPALWPLSPENIKLKRISGAFTNAVFFASYKLDPAPDTQVTPPPTVLLRVYGVGSEVLLSRRAELLILHTLSSLYEIGPHILGTFANGRVEEFYDCDPIQKEGMRDFGDREAYMIQGGSLMVKGREGRAHWVARRMNELHSVPLEVMKTVLEQGNLRGPSQKGFGRGIENHIMACSHRPRRKARTRPTPALPDNVSSPQIYGLDSRNLVRASPAPMGPGEASPANAIEMNPYGYAHRNSSAVSLDSLATSYNSQSSFFGDSPSVAGIASPDTSAMNAANDPANSYFPPVTNGPMSPLALNPVGKPASKQSARGPYPGVWRRLKRWSREAAKTIELVDNFARSESGAKAIAMCFAGHPSIRQEMQKGDVPLGTQNIGPTPGNLRNTLRCIKAIDLVSLFREVDEFKQFVRRWERREGPSRRVFAHNDAQYGNLLAIKHFPPRTMPVSTGSDLTRKEIKSGSLDTPSIPAGMPRLPSHDSRRESTTSMTTNNGSATNRAKSQTRTRGKKTPPLHHRIVVIDFEYASPNPRGYDIANHFQEWRADYHHPTLSWSLTHHGSYPDEQQRRKWLRAYVEQGRLLRMGGKMSKGAAPTALESPTDMVLPPPVMSVQSPAADTMMKGPITSDRSCTPVTPGTGAAQVAALEASCGDRPKSSSSSSLKGSTSSSLVNQRRGSTLEANLQRSQGSEVQPMKPLGRRTSNESISSSSWQAPPSGPLRPVTLSVPSTPANCLNPTSPPFDGSASPQLLALAHLDASIEKEVDRLEREVQLWSPATHAVWGLWGIVFAKQEVESVLQRAKAEAEGQPVAESVLGEAHIKSIFEVGCAEDFDNLRYALGRIELFRQEFRRLVQIGIEAI